MLGQANITKSIIFYLLPLAARSFHIVRLYSKQSSHTRRNEYLAESTTMCKLENFACD